MKGKPYKIKVRNCWQVPMRKKPNPAENAFENLFKAFYQMAARLKPEDKKKLEKLSEEL